MGLLRRCRWKVEALIQSRESPIAFRSSQKSAWCRSRRTGLEPSCRSGGALGLAYYFEYRPTHDVDASLGRKQRHRRIAKVWSSACRMSWPVTAACERDRGETWSAWSWCKTSEWFQFSDREQGRAAGFFHSGTMAGEHCSGLVSRSRVCQDERPGGARTPGVQLVIGGMSSSAAALFQLRGVQTGPGPRFSEIQLRHRRTA